ncbi:class I SAM-dependent methyltransferase [Azospirillum sp. TSO22-1]|uniref:TylF/MycF/NovP-related O-methyltransferase n=1 Tax=Azospirillum sp. TSO22-1 TaxID=716789 RepID=UPI000D64F432|nr:class I SAM-dependent methyltransferase [Azospirillum sp. TSO22-1]
MTDPLQDARALLAAGRFDAALKRLAGVPGADVLLGAAYAARRDPARAFAHLRRALTENPGDPEALFHLGRAHLAASDAHRAVGVLESVAALAPGLPGLTDTLAGACRRDARYVAALRVAATVPDPSIDLLYEVGLCHNALGVAAPALAAFDALLARDPEHAAGWLGSHAPALHLHGPDEALRRVERAVTQRGANGKYWALLAVYRRLLGDEAGARALHLAHVAGQPRRRALWDSVDAVVPFLSTDVRLFALSGPLLEHAVAQAAVPGLVLEFGVRRGTSIDRIAAAAGQAVHGFDSFEGLPEAWGAEPRGVLSAGGQLPKVRSNVTLHAGWFEDTLPSFLAAHPGDVRLVNVDSDIYSSAKTVLTALADRIRPGSVLVFDEFVGNRTWRDDEYKAFQEFVQATGARWEVFALSPFTKQVAVRILGAGAGVVS